MALKTTAELMKWANKRKRAVCAFNVTNMELVQAVTRTAKDAGVPVILQATKSGFKYAGMDYMKALVDAAVKETGVDIALHLDHGDTFELCKHCIDNGFTSVMIDGSALPFEENVALTKQVVDYAHKRGVSVEGELGKIAGIEDHVEHAYSNYTDPDQAKEFVERTGVDMLAVSIGTAHGAFKYKSDPQLRFDILEEIQKKIPNTPLVLHGASSVTPADLFTIVEHGGNMKGALGVGEVVLAQTIKMGVRKINIDSDLRLGMTAAIRKYFTEKPDHFDPRQYLAAARDHVAGVVKLKLETFSC